MSMKTALYFAEHPVEKLSLVAIGIWRRIAEKRLD